MWKPGQIVTIQGNRYQIRNTDPFRLDCQMCDIRHTANTKPICDKCIKNLLIPDYCHFKLIKLKRSE